MKWIAFFAGVLIAIQTTLAQQTPVSAEELKSRLASFLERFPASDADKDGQLTMEEFRAFQGSGGGAADMEARLKQALERFPQADVNQDGTLSQGEFRAFQQKRQAMQREQAAARKPGAQPTHSDVAYGPHEKQRFDLWTVLGAEAPTPLVIYIHGGGFRGGDKAGVDGTILKACLDAGVAFASMNYRLSDVGPYPIMMHDAARGLQTLRHRAKEWNLDPERIVCYGGSAGAGISLWLAFHDDLAYPESDDPIARQSTRILAAATLNGQSTYDMHTYRDWFGVPDLPVHDALPAFLGVGSGEELEKESVKIRMRDASPITHLSEDDPDRVYMFFNRPNTPVTKDTPQGEWVHHVLLGLKLQEAMAKLDKTCIVVAPGLESDDPFGSVAAFVVAMAKGE